MENSERQIRHICKEWVISAFAMGQDHWPENVTTRNNKQQKIKKCHRCMGDPMENWDFVRKGFFN